MSRTLESEMPAFRILIALFFVSMPLAAACGDSAPGNEAESTPTAQEVLNYCSDVARMRNSLLDVQDALFPLDEVAMQEARAHARADFDYLEGSALQLQGGASAADQPRNPPTPMTPNEPNAMAPTVTQTQATTTAPRNRTAPPSSVRIRRATR